MPIDQREWSWGQVHDFVWYAVLRRWHRRAYRAARRLHEQIGFDLVHQVTFCGYREPGYLWKLGRAVRLGAHRRHAGLSLAVPAFGRHRRGHRRESAAAWSTICNCGSAARVRRAARKAAVVLAANSANQRRFGRAHGIAPPIVARRGHRPRRRRAAQGAARRVRCACCGRAC